MNPENKSLLRKVFRRGIWENLSTALIIGVVMLLQPYMMVLYTYSFNFILGGTLTFLIVSHFPSGKS